LVVTMLSARDDICVCAGILQSLFLEESELCLTRLTFFVYREGKVNCDAASLEIPSNLVHQY
jgi:hypothetical protein